MRRSRTAVTKALLAGTLTACMLAAASASGQTAAGNGPSVSITSVSGFAGHAFVFAQVTDSSVAYPAPAGSGHQSPYFAQWVAHPFSAAGCPWIWAVYVYERATGRQINLPPPGTPAPNYGTSTLLCASPPATPVEQPPQTDASARLDLDLQVGVTPAESQAGTPSQVSAVLSGALTEDLDLYLNMAIEDWSVTRWSVDFGDGQTAERPGSAATTMRVPHVYQAAGHYDARVVASISGHAQAALYDRYGAVHLIERPFSVEIGNHALAGVRRQPVRVYVPPHVTVAVSPSLAGSGVAAGSVAFRRVDVLRGAPIDFVIRLVVDREGIMTVDGVPRGFAVSRLSGWRYDGPPSDGSSGTRTGVIHRGSDPLSLQWNSPDHILGSQGQDYSVRVALVVQSRYPDGHLATFVIPSSFAVTVNFAAEGG